MTVLKRSIMTLYSGPADLDSHQARIVLAEKGVTVDVLSIDVNKPDEDLLSLNPYGTFPTLVDRDLVLYDVDVIMEYLDERFPHPPLLPVYPIARAKSRLMLQRIESDWYGLARIIEKADSTSAQKEDARKALRDMLVTLTPVFAESNYFLSEEFTLVDCRIAPLLWRLPLFGITLPPSAKSILKYQSRVFAREAFQASLTEVEREMQEIV
ncbi:MAG: stringent starvation protein A [Gammaproteobacteria bacterium CG_4_10_14_0_8_um_filter_38_16]|nr:MAG: stringent starvation protein A [Gammaproteobacteria bacterium CG_4_10_14_0_8_um_filter_38_16]PJA03823.1 MAG: stringent starvation protein A [Gammaproteobacteria bacterium CG_4_10_14_0_2_um_filter_38_22]PJB10797.1 MAG: stringent starvation protein A [Gammaproteobacteria bacterium CG_4_9_14_3_um_filter_38_9]